MIIEFLAGILLLLFLVCFGICVWSILESDTEFEDNDDLDFERLFIIPSEHSVNWKKGYECNES
jgi:hypothetical protein